MLYNFYGTECSHCHNMAPLIDRLEKETGVTVDRRETWHDKTNAELLAQYDKNLCGGVPFFFNTETGAHICGEADYEELKAWAGK